MPTDQEQENQGFGSKWTDLTKLNMMFLAEILKTHYLYDDEQVSKI